MIHRRVVFLLPPTGAWCREDRCQSYFRFELVPSQRAPLEECEAAGAVRAAGGEAFVVDAPAEGLAAGEALARVASLAPDLVVLIATFGSLADDLLFAKPLKERLPDAVIGIRGAPCYTQAEAILMQAGDIDFAVRGDYELVFDEVVRLGHRRAAGCVYREAAGFAANPAPKASDLDRLPRPDRSSLDPNAYRVRGLGAPQASVRVQRGCPFPCSYCLVHTVSGNRARHRSPESVADEMRELCEAGTRHFYLRAETFSLDRDWAIATSDAIARTCPEARWVTTTRVDCVDERVVVAMARSGCYGISFGIDVASNTIGERVDKRPDLARASAAMRSCDRHGILSLGYFMLGFLWESPQTVAETVRFARTARPDLLTIHFAHPYPGTRYYEDVREAGIRLDSLRAQAEPALGEAGVSPVALRRAARRLLLRHYGDPRVHASITRKAARLLWDRATKAKARS